MSEPIIIHKHEWDDYYEVQQSGRMNMMHHWCIRKFLPDGNYEKARTHFEENGNTNQLTIGGSNE